MEKCRARFRSDRFLKAGLIALLALILCGAAIGAAAGAAATGGPGVAEGTAGHWVGDVFMPNPEGYSGENDFKTLADELNSDGHTGTVLYSEGRFELQEDIKLGGTLKIGGNTEKGSPISLDLYGHTLEATGDGNFSVITVNESLELTDNIGGGKVTGGKGTLKGDVTMGGGVAVGSGCTFTMSGTASITGNSATMGGGVFVEEGGTFNVNSAPVIKGNTGANGAANNVYLAAAAEQQGQALITVTHPLKGGEIWIANPPTESPNAPFAQKGDSYSGDFSQNAKYFHPDAGFAGAKVGEDADADKLYWDTNPALIEYNGNKYTGTYTAENYILNCPLFNQGEATYGDRVLTLEQPVTLDMGTLIILAPMTNETPFTINLKGQVLKATPTDQIPFSVITIAPGAELAVKDETNTAEHWFEYAAPNAVWTLYDDTPEEGDTVKIYDSLDAFDRAEADYFLNKVHGTNKVYIKVTGGVITGGTGTDEGGKNGENAGNSATNGGGVIVLGGEFTMSGGSIAGNSATMGGGVAVGSGCTFTMSGGSIAGNEVTGEQAMGGGVYVFFGGTFNVSGAPVIKGNTKISEDNTNEDAANNVYLAPGKKGGQAHLTVTGDFSGEIYVNNPEPVESPVTPIQFGTIAAGVSNPGADHFISDAVSDGKHYVGEKGIAVVGGDELKWKGSATAYPITIASDIEHGTVSASRSAAEPSTQEKMVEITLTATPDEGFELDKWDVKAGGTAVTVTGDKFPMPSSDVTVSATFKKSGPEPTPVPTYTVTFDSAGGSPVSPQEVAEGSTASKPSPDPTKDGHTFAHWLDENGAKYNFSTPVTKDITLTAKWNTKAPETDEEIEETIEDLIDHPDKEISLPVVKKESAKRVLMFAAVLSVCDRISFDLTAGDKEELKDLICEAKTEEENYGPVNLETAEDTKEEVIELIKDEEIPKENIGLPVKADGSNINVVLEVIEECAEVKDVEKITIPVPDTVTVPEGTELKPAEPTVEIISEILTKAQNSATSDNAHITLSDDNREHVKKLAKKQNGIIIRVNKDNHDLIRELISEKYAIALTLETEEDAEFIKELAEEHSDIIVEVTEGNYTLIENLLGGGTPLTLMAAENGSNIEKISDLIGRHTGVKIEIPQGTKIKPTQANKAAVINVLKAARESGTADNLVFEVDDSEETAAVIKEIITDAASGGYGPVNLGISEDTYQTISYLLKSATEEERENIALVVKKGTKITPAKDTKEDIINVLKAAKKSGTADNLLFEINTPEEAEAVKEIAKELPGIVVKVTDGNYGLIEALIEEDASITLTLENELDKELIKELAEEHPGITVEVTEKNRNFIADLLEGGTQLTLMAAENGSNIETILELQESCPEAAMDVKVPDKIIFSKKVEMKITGSNTETLRDILIAASEGHSADKVTLDLKFDRANVKGAVSLIGDKNIDGNNIQLIQIPDGVAIGTKDNLAKELPYDVDSKEVEEKLKLSDIQISGISSAAALSNNDETLIEDASISIPELKDPSRGYKDLVVFSVFQVIAKAKDGKPVELTLKFKPAGLGTAPDAKQYYIRHYNTNTSVWESHIAPKKAVITPEGYVECTYEVTEFSPFALVTETQIKNNSSQGTSVWGTETAEPTVIPTEVPTAQPTPEVPTVKPTASPTETPKSPMAIAGVLAGLGAAACVLAARRK